MNNNQGIVFQTYVYIPMPNIFLFVSAYISLRMAVLCQPRKPRVSLPSSSPLSSTPRIPYVLTRSTDSAASTQNTITAGPDPSNDGSNAGNSPAKPREPEPSE
ncbi:hypothetical protein FS842_007835 [Serendipita sp. 407]|nr:hypothetical protein FS842_007835 [Serendipita sp. 407]